MFVEIRTLSRVYIELWSGPKPIFIFEASVDADAEA